MHADLGKHKSKNSFCKGIMEVKNAIELNSQVIKRRGKCSLAFQRQGKKLRPLLLLDPLNKSSTSASFH